MLLYTHTSEKNNLSDALQSDGLIALCLEFNWNSIAVVYVNDPYGLFLSLGIQDLAKQHDISVTSIAISYENDVTYTYAANQIKELGIYIIILILHSSATPFIEFEEAGILGYPYFYLGVDAWLDTTTVKEWTERQISASETHHINNLTGFIGTVPWQSTSLDVHEYSTDKRDVQVPL